MSSTETRPPQAFPRSDESLSRFAWFVVLYNITVIVWGALLCQRLDENARRLASILDAPFYVVHLEGLVALFGGKRIALSHSARYGQGPKKGCGMTIRVADLLVDVLAEAGVRRIYGVVGDSLNGIGKLQAPIVHALRGKEFIEYDNPSDVGLTGLLGFSSGYHQKILSPNS